ncbi:MAG: helix-turn-helix transcriptional regulator [Methylophaga sp.]|uniref:helix-turn-helix domain-containing protein n=1 Tax=Methylophaga sp. TaxID=2024840 RepID=UPI000C11D57F|nr:helix-turn-helix transcriptional regulator [Methylophaga sp.]MBL1456499.1 helix-turn-helix transcriptional regulator [Methylophaga sp.]
MTKTALGAKIRELRTKKRYTLEKLADLTDSSKSYIWELENKAPPRPSAEKISKIAEQLGVTIEYLLDDQANITVENAADVRFYRKYQQMDDKTKAKIRSFVDLWDEDDDG